MSRFTPSRCTHTQHHTLPQQHQPLPQQHYTPPQHHHLPQQQQHTSQQQHDTPQQHGDSSTSLPPPLTHAARNALGPLDCGQLLPPPPLTHATLLQGQTQSVTPSVPAPAHLPPKQGGGGHEGGVSWRQRLVSLVCACVHVCLCVCVRLCERAYVWACGTTSKLVVSEGALTQTPSLPRGQRVKGGLGWCVFVCDAKC